MNLCKFSRDKAKELSLISYFCGLESGFRIWLQNTFHVMFSSNDSMCIPQLISFKH